MMTRLMISALVVLALAAGAFAQKTAMPADTIKGKMPVSPVNGALIIEKEPVFNDLPGYGKKCWIGEAYYFTYKFDKKPKLGTAILIVQLFDKAGARVTSLGVVGMTGMPSMSGAHDSGKVAFQLNKKGDYLLPVNVVMPGEWEVKLVFSKDKAPIYHGRFLFKV
jgi:hypothetical protein